MPAWSAGCAWGRRVGLHRARRGSKLLDVANQHKQVGLHRVKKCRMRRPSPWRAKQNKDEVKPKFARVRPELGRIRSKSAISGTDSAEEIQPACQALACSSREMKMSATLAPARDVMFVQLSYAQPSGCRSHWAVPRVGADRGWKDTAERLEQHVSGVPPVLYGAGFRAPDRVGRIW